jgi:hypothetical protein
MKWPLLRGKQLPLPSGEGGESSEKTKFCATKILKKAATTEFPARPGASPQPSPPLLIKDGGEGAAYGEGKYFA